jgi:hypothetical protein
MAKDKIIVEYIAETGGIKKQLDDLEKDFKGVETSSVKAGESATKSFNDVGKSVDNLKKKVAEVETTTKKAFVSKPIEDYAARAAKSTGVLQNSVNQLTRELPAFTFSAQTGFLAISNNIPILTDSIGRLRAENNALAAEGKPTTSIFKQLAGALFSFNTLISVGVTLLSVYGKEISTFVMGLFKSDEATKEYAQSVEGLNEKMKDLSKTIDDQYALQLKLTEARGQDSFAIKETIAIEKLTGAILETTKRTQEFNDVKNKLGKITAQQENNRASEFLALQSARYSSEFKEKKQLLDEQLKIEQSYKNALQILYAEYYKGLREKEKERKDNVEKNLNDLQKIIEDYQVNNILAEQARELAKQELSFKREKQNLQAKYSEYNQYLKAVRLAEERNQQEVEKIKEKYRKQSFDVMANDTMPSIDYDKQIEELKKRLEKEKDLTVKNNIKIQQETLKNAKAALDEYEAYQKQKEEDELKRKKSIIDTVASTTLKVLDVIAQRQRELDNIRINEIQTEADVRLKALDKRFAIEEGAIDKRTARERAYDKERERIERQRDERIKLIQREGFEREKKANIVRASVAGGIAALQASGVPIVGLIQAAAIAVATGIEVAFIASQPNPYAKGTNFVDRENRYKSGIDTVPALLTKGERVITVEDNKENWQLYEAVRTKRLNNFINYKYVNPALKQQEQQHRRSELNNIFNNSNFDDSKIVKELKRSTSTSQRNTYELAKVLKSTITKPYER